MNTILENIIFSIIIGFSVVFIIFYSISFIVWNFNIIPLFGLLRLSVIVSFFTFLGFTIGGFE